MTILGPVSRHQQLLIVFITISKCQAWTFEKIRSRNNNDYFHRILSQVVGISLGASITLTANPYPCQAGPVGEKITQVVTQSDVGVAVRRSVVRGAQIMDGFDANWERFSDQFGLGEARKIQPGRPEPKVIPELKQLDSKLAANLLDATDRAVMKSLSCSASDLQRQIELVTSTVRASFERSGLDVSKLLQNNNIPQSGPEFSYLAYCHYKAYVDLFAKQQTVSFPTFQRDLELASGQEILSALLPEYRPAKGPRCTEWKTAVKLIEQLDNELVNRGLVADASSIINDESGLEWCEDGGELTFSVALDGEATLGAQTLLQEQGYRLYPNFGRNAIAAILRGIDNTDVTVDDYYMDTDYNSDPDKFEVRELLLNVVLETL